MRLLGLWLLWPIELDTSHEHDMMSCIDIWVDAIFWIFCFTKLGTVRIRLGWVSRGLHSTCWGPTHYSWSSELTPRQPRQPRGANCQPSFLAAQAAMALGSAHRGQFTHRHHPTSMGSRLENQHLLQTKIIINHQQVILPWHFCWITIGHEGHEGHEGFMFQVAKQWKMVDILFSWKQTEKRSDCLNAPFG